MVKNGTVPQFISQTGDEKETQLGRIIHERTNKRNRTWEERGRDVVDEANQLKAEEAAREQALKSMWKSKDQELDQIFDRLSTI